MKKDKDICYDCAHIKEMHAPDDIKPEIKCEIFSQVRFAMDECSEYLDFNQGRM